MILFGSGGIFGIIEYLIWAVLAIVPLMFRKISNDTLNMGFSVIGSITAAELVFSVARILGLNARYSLGLGIIALFAAGFFLAEALGDGQAN